MQETFLSPCAPVQTVSNLAELSAKCGVNLDCRNTPQAGTPGGSRHETPSLPAHTASTAPVLRARPGQPIDLTMEASKPSNDARDSTRSRLIRSTAALYSLARSVCS